MDRGQPELLAEAYAALAGGDWAAARHGFEEALRARASGEVLDGLAQALFSAGEYGAAIERGEQAYAAFRSAGRDAQAASCARFVGYLHGVVHGDGAVAGGWLSRAARLLESAGDCPERARFELTRAVVATEPGERERHLAAAEEAATRHGLTDLLFDAMSQRGLHLVAAGDVRAGMALLDEALAAVAGGEVTDLVSVGAMYCKMLLACELTSDVLRAQDWLVQADRFVARTNRIPIGAICRTHYGGVLIAAGRWPEAEAELDTALALYDRSYRALRAAALVRLAGLRVRQGRLAEADNLLSGSEHDAAAVRPRVELDLARGEPDLAAARAERALPDDPALVAPLLFLLTRAHLARGDPGAAAGTATRLHDVATASSADWPQPSPSTRRAWWRSRPASGPPPITSSRRTAPSAGSGCRGRRRGPGSTWQVSSPIAPPSPSPTPEPPSTVSALFPRRPTWTPRRACSAGSASAVTVAAPEATARSPHVSSRSSTSSGPGCPTPPSPPGSTSVAGRWSTTCRTSSRSWG